MNQCIMSRAIANARPRGRPGMASLEFVLVFPMLLAMAAGLFLLAHAVETKSATAITARQDAGNQRPQAPAGETLWVFSDPLDSAIQADPQRTFTSGPPI